MAEIWHQLGSIRPCKQWDKLKLPISADPNFFHDNTSWCLEGSDLECTWTYLTYQSTHLDADKISIAKPTATIRKGGWPKWVGNCFLAIYRMNKFIFMIYTRDICKKKSNSTYKPVS